MVEARVFHSVITVPDSLSPNPYKTHQALWKGFQDLPSGSPQPFTFRELDVDVKQRVFLVQSKKEPDWAKNKIIHLLQPISEHIFEIREDDYFLYRVVSAPMVKVKVEGKKHSRHVALKTDERIWEWFSKRCEGNGMMIEKFTTQFISERRHYTHPNFGRFYLTYACFDGVCKILEPEKIVNTIENGFSSKKAFGFGMLNLMQP